MYLVDIEDSCLLGLDYLLQNLASLHFKDMTMRIQGIEVPLLEVNGRAQVVVAEATRMLPRSDIRVRCRLSRKMEGEVSLAESSPACRMQEGLMVDQTLVLSGDEKVTLLGANLDDQERRIPTGATLGT